MMGSDCVHDIIPFTVLLGKVTADNSVGAFHFMVNSLADVMQQTGPLGFLHIQPKL